MILSGFILFDLSVFLILTVRLVGDRSLDYSLFQCRSKVIFAEGRPMRESESAHNISRRHLPVTEDFG